MTRVLVVDDDQTILDVVTDILQMYDYEVDTALNGCEALAKLRGAQQHGDPPDVVLLDLMMPVMDGWAFLNAYRADQQAPRVPVGIMSAAREVKAACADLKPQACVPKPFDLDVLLDAVERLSRGESLPLPAAPSVAA